MAKEIQQDWAPFENIAPFLLGAVNTGMLVSPGKTGFRR